MAYDLPRLADLSQRARRLFAEAIPGAVVDVWPNTFAVVAKVLAAAQFEIHLRLAFLYRQLFASTADGPWLVRHGFELGVNAIPAQRATGFATVASTVGVLIPAGVTFQRSDGALFQTRTSTLGAGASTSIELEAVTPGAAGNTSAAEALALVDIGTVSGLGEAAMVGAGGLGGGAEAEATETFRQRILDRKRNPPQGGSVTDWVAWAREADPAITRVFVDSFINDSRQVWISFLRGDRTNGIPTSGDVAAVQAYVSDPVRRPVTARVTVVAPTAVAVNVSIQGLATDNVNVRAAIAAELAAMFAEKAAPATPTTTFVLWRAWIDEAISRATGEVRHTLITPSTDLAYSTAGQIPVLGTISYV